MGRGAKITNRAIHLFTHQYEALASFDAMHQSWLLGVTAYETELFVIAPMAVFRLD